MGHFRSLYLFSLVFFAFSVSLTGCSSDDMDGATDNEEKKSVSYISFTVRIASETRSTRSGSTKVDYGEGGINHENDLNNMTVFLYKSSAGINAPDVTPVSNAVYWGEDQINDFLLNPQPVNDLTLGEYHIIAVANMGDLTSLVNYNLGQLRDYIALKSQIWTGAAGISDYHSFAMVSSNDGTIRVATEGGSLDDPYNSVLHIERIASRIDIVPGANLSNGYYEYEVGVSQSLMPNRVRITNIYPVNMLNSGAYLIKRVTNGSSTESFFYLGKEKYDDTQTNITIDPWTLLKNGALPVGLQYINHLSFIEGSYPVQPVGDDGFYILNYVLENTVLPSYQVPSYTTGIVMEGKIVPGAIFDRHGNEISGYNPGDDLWYLNGAFYNENMLGSTKYSNGTCYYTYWIRHINDAGTDSPDGYMNNILRNHIYRLYIQSIPNYGFDKPDYTPASAVDRIDVAVQVIPWWEREHSSVIM